MIDYMHYKRLFMDRSEIANDGGSRETGTVIAAAQDTVHTRSDIRMARVASGQSVIVEGEIVASEVSVGESSKPEQELGRLVGEINGQLQAMAVAAMQLSKNAAHKGAARSQAGFGSLLQALCERKFAPLPELIASLCRTAKANIRDIDKEWLILCHKLKASFTAPYASELTSVSELALLVERVDRLHRRTVVKGGRSDCLLRAGYASNSCLYSSGDIRIEGSVENASLYTLGFVHIEGYALGSEVYAEQGVRIREAGGRGGAPTRIRVPAGKTVVIDHARAGTMIQIGTRTHTIVRASDFYVV